MTEEAVKRAQKKKNMTLISTDDQMAGNRNREEEVKAAGSGAMDADTEEQDDELLALHSIFDSGEFVRESRSAGEIRVSVELPAGFTVVLREGKSLRQYEMSFLPPLRLTFELPEDYPSSSPPSFSLTCSWLTNTQLSALGAQLTDLYQATGGAVVLFSWVLFLKEDALRFLDIHTLLELNTQRDGQNSFSVALSGPTNNQPAPTPGPTDNVIDPCQPDLSALPSEVELPIGILADSKDPTTSDWSNTDSWGAVANDSNQIAQTSDVMETLQSSQLKADNQNDLSSVAGKPKHLPFAASDHRGQDDFLNKGDVSASLVRPSSSSDPLDQSEQGAASLPIHSSESQRLSGLSLTPSQTLLSQLLIDDAAQRQKMFATTVFDCGVCFVGWLGSECVQLPECGHVFCQACLGKFCQLQIKEGNVKGVTCPVSLSKCSNTTA